MWTGNVGAGKRIEQPRANGLGNHLAVARDRRHDRVAIVDHGKIIALDTPKSLVAGLGAPKVVVHEGTLEDVFMSLTGRLLRDE